MKKIIILSLILMVLSTINISAIENEDFNTDVFDELDLWIVVNMHVWSDINNENIETPWNLLTNIVSKTPLYDTSNNIIAYYVTLNDGSYIVVNANRDNPVVIEFGYSKGNLEILSEMNVVSLNESKNYYFAPGVYGQSTCKNNESSFRILSGEKTEDISIDNEAYLKASMGFSKLLNDYNEDTSSLLKKTKKIVEKEIIANDYRDFNIFPESGLPSTDCKDDDIPSISLTWGTTSEFENYASDHCGATSAFNMVLYYLNRVGMPVSSSNRVSTFKGLHNYIGNGPVLPMAYRNGIAAYVHNILGLSSPTVGSISSTWNNVITKTEEDIMTYYIVWPTILEAHYINGIGYRDYGNVSQRYVRVIDNWTNTTDRYYWFAVDLFQMGYVEITL